MTNRETNLQDFTSYRITQIEPLCMEEVGLVSKVCLYSGATYIDILFRRLLKNHLSSIYAKGQVITEKRLDKAEHLFAVAMSIMTYCCVDKLTNVFRTTSHYSTGICFRYAIYESRVLRRSGRLATDWAADSFAMRINLPFCQATGIVTTYRTLPRFSSSSSQVIW